jgi:hypothetical protein
MLTLSDAVPPQDPTTADAPIVKPPAIEMVKIKALSTWNALTIGVITGFALSLGTFIFESARDKIRARR